MASIMARDDGGGGGLLGESDTRCGVIEYAPIELREQEGWAMGARTVAGGR